MRKITLKLIELILGYPLYIISFLFKRNKYKIVVGSHTPFNDNSKYFYLLSEKYMPGYNLIWITNNLKVQERLKNKNKKVYMKNSLLGLYHSLTAMYYVYSFHVIDINFWTSGGCIKFNLWHGIPLKNIGFSTKKGPSARVYDEKSIMSRIIRPHVYVRPHYMLTTSAIMSDYFSKAFRIKQSQCLEYGLTRCDIFKLSSIDLKEYIRINESLEMYDFIIKLESYEEVVIYMPTWREEIDFLLMAGFDFYELNNLLKRENKSFIFKLHPYTRLDKINLSKVNEYSNIFILPNDMDVYPVLPFTSYLITDYSSIYYDYLLLNNRVVYLYPFDYDKYVLNSRDLAFDYNDKMPGEKISDFLNLLKIIERKKHARTFEQDNIKKEYFSNRINMNSIENLSNFIKHRNIKDL